MDSTWAWPTWILCLYGFFKELRPSEPYLTEYLTGPWKNISKTDVNTQIYPVWTYSYLAFLVVVFVVTDFLRYKPVIVLQAIAYIITWVLLLWAPGVFAMQMMEFVYGLVTASDTAYYSYIYAKVSPQHFKKVTAFTHAAILFGRFLSGVLSQSLVSTNLLDYHQLNYVSLGCVSTAMVVSLFLPTVSFSIYFHRHNREQTEKSPEPDGTDQTSAKPTCASVWKHIWSDFKDAYSSFYQLKWCLWWSLATCDHEQVGNYIQTLWEEIYPSNDHPGEAIYNGAVTAVNTLLGAVVSLTLAFVTVDWMKWSEFTIATVSLLDGGLLLACALATNIWVAYIGYALYVCSFDMLSTVASFQIARRLKQDSYGLVFGCNSFVALVLQTILTVIVNSKAGFQATPRTQFVVYSGYALVTAALFTVIAIHTWCKRPESTNYIRQRP